MSILKDQLIHASELLQSRFQTTSSYKNPNTNGSIKEDFIREEIEQRLPGGIMFGKGEIIDSFGISTGEQDLVGYDRHFMPIFQHHGTVSTFFVESVFCCIEAKSTLNKNALLDAAAKFQQIRKLKRVYKAANLSEYKAGVLGVGGFKGTMGFGAREQKGDIPRIITGIIGFNSVNPTTLSDHLKSIGPDADLVCVLGVGCWVRRWDQNSWIEINSSPELAYYNFIVWLYELNNSHLLRHLYGQISLSENYL